MAAWKSRMCTWVSPSSRLAARPHDPRAAFDVSPWKLAGWGMYATPRFDRSAWIYGRRATGDADSSPPPSAPSATLRPTTWNGIGRAWPTIATSPSSLTDHPHGSADDRRVPARIVATWTHHDAASQGTSNAR
jgi:hypothetical protein